MAAELKSKFTSTVNCASFSNSGKLNGMRGGRGGLPGIVADIVQGSLAHRSRCERDPAATHALQAPGDFGRVQSRLRRGCAQRDQLRGGADEEDLLRFHC